MKFNLKVFLTTLLTFIFAACGDIPKIEHEMFSPSYLQAVSHYRSCCGHAYTPGGGTGSYKHYFFPLDSVPISNDHIPLYAPFDGSVVSIEAASNNLPCFGGVPHGYNISIAAKSNPNFLVTMFHVNLKGSKGSVKAGEHIGWADVRACEFPNQENIASVPATFDIALEGTLDELESIFNHMTPSVLSVWSSFGITPSDIIISEEFRSSNACTSYDRSACEPGMTCLNGQTCK